jgi:hypothetical protein
MWERIVEIAKTASAMLHSGKVPPNTPPQYKENLSKVNFLASKKFYVVFCSVVILALFYGISIFVLFLTAASPSLTVPFVSIFTETIKILAVIIASYLGVQTILDYKMQSNNNLNLEGSNSYTKEEIDQKIIMDYAEKYKDDPSYAPLDWIKERDTSNE